MRKTALGSSTVLIGLLALMMISGFALADWSGQQPEPTAQQQTIDAIVQGYFQGTATAEAGLNATATAEAALNAIQTATAVVDQAQTATLGAAFSAAQTATWQAANPAFRVDNLRVISVEEFPLMAGPGRSGAYLAPNGERFAHLNGDELCIYTIQGREERCIALVDSAGERYMVTGENIVWSPDSRYLTMASEEFFLTFRDPDILVADADTGILRNITDDNTDCAVVLTPDENCESTIDLLPQWLPSGDRLTFLRLERIGSRWNTELFGVDWDGGNLESLGRLIMELYPYAFAVSDDGSRIAYNYDLGSSNVFNGLWTSTLSGRDIEQIIAAEDRSQIPLAMDFSPDGDYLITVNDLLLGQNIHSSEPEFSSYQVASLEAREQLLIDPNLVVRGAGWSPYGSALAYIVFDPLERAQSEPAVSGLYLTNTAGEPGTRVLPGIFYPPTSRGRQPLTWGANNTLLLTEPGQPRLFAIRLGE